MLRLLPAALCSAGVLALAAPAATADEVSGARALAVVREVAAGGPRPAGSAAERRAHDIVARRLRSLRYRVLVQEFSLPSGGRSRNVVGITSRPVRAVVVAHADGVRAGPAANDNGSGLAAALEVARALRGTPGVLVAALGAEERVETGSRLHLGSVRLARGLSRRTVRIALSLDMVGYGPSLHARGLEAQPNRSAALVLAQARRLGLPATYRQDSGQSDHAEITRAGIPAAWIQWRWDPCWHSACDVASRVRPEKIEATARLALAAVRGALSATR